MKREARMPRRGARTPSGAHAARRRAFGCLREESGAVAVDWVVLTAALVALGVGVLGGVRGGVANVSADIAPDMAGRLGALHSAGGEAAGDGGGG